MVGGTTSYSWGIGSAPSARQISDFESKLDTMRNCLVQSGGPFLGGDNVTLVKILSEILNRHVNW